MCTYNILSKGRGKKEEKIKVLILANMFAWQPVCNATQVVHTLRLDQNNSVNSGHYVCLAAHLQCHLGSVRTSLRPTF
jgi:hypothetical protein